MKQQTIGKVVFGFLGLAVLVSLGSSKGQDHGSSDDDHGSTSEGQAAAAHAADEHGEQIVRNEGPHDRAPRDVSMTVEGAPNGAWLRSPERSWFLAQPERFGEELLFPEGGKEYPAFQDAETGDIYVERYDEEEDVSAWWMKVSNARLVAGRRDYVQYCASCHGFDGQGYGRSAQALRPPPRNFTTESGNFKFTKILAGLPTDEALMSVVRNGLEGTPMLKWDLSDRQLSDIIQYIKFLSPPQSNWRDVYAEIGDKVDMGEDPWKDEPERAVMRGERLYHTSGECYACHPGYAPQPKIREYRGEAADFQLRDNLTYPELKESDYYVLGKQVYFLPPDFTWHQVRSGTTTRDLAETIASGIKGTAMPQWKGALPDKDIWAIAHYVENLIHEYKDQPSKRAAFFAPLRAE